MRANVNPPGRWATLPGGIANNQDLENSTSSPCVLQARAELILEDLVNTIGGMQAALDAAVAMAAIPSNQGMLHGLRQARACWKVIAASAADLSGLDAELASLLRQEGAL